MPALINLVSFLFQLGFLRRDKAGTTTLAVLNPGQVGGEESKQVNLGLLTGRLTQGAGSLPGFREDKRNKAVPGRLPPFSCWPNCVCG